MLVKAALWLWRRRYLAKSSELTVGTGVKGQVAQSGALAR